MTTCTGDISATLAALAIAEEANCGVTPPGMLTPVDPVAMDKTGASAGRTNVTRGSGSFVTDGFLVDHYVNLTGFSTTANNGNWRVAAVSALTLELYDPDGAGVDEVSGGGQACVITMALVRATERDIQAEFESLESPEVSADRMLSDVRAGAISVSGSIGFVLSNIDQSDLIRFGLGGVWEAPSYTGGTLTLSEDDPAAGQSTLTRTTNNWEDDGFRVGDFVLLADFAPAAYNGVFNVLSISGQAMVIDTEDAAGVTATDTDGSISYPGYRMDVGSNFRSFVVERRSDDGPIYQLFNGIAVQGLSFDMSPGSTVTGTASLIGTTAAAMSASSVIGAVVPVPVSTKTSFAAFTGAVYENGSKVTSMTAASLSLENNRTLEQFIGTRYSRRVYEGQARVNGSMSFVIDGITRYNRFWNETESSGQWVLDDPSSANEFMSIYVPRLRFTSAPLEIGSEGPVVSQMDFQGLKTTVKDASGSDTSTILTIQSNPIR